MQAVPTKLPLVVRAAPLHLLTVLGSFVACGSTRLENAFQPSAEASVSGTSSEAGTLAVAGSGGAGAASVAGAGGSNPPEAGGGGGSGGSSAEASGAPPMGGDAAVPPLAREPIVALADFPASFMQGPVDAKRFDVAGLPFTQAWRATMTEQPSQTWTGQLIVPQSKRVVKGQLLHVSFWIRCEQPGAKGDCYTEFIFERNSDPWEKSVTVPAHAGSDWVQKSEFFSTVDTYEVDAAHMLFRLGFATQVIDIGGLEVEAVGDPP